MSYNRSYNKNRKKRTISPEQQEKMQEARRKNAIQKKQMDRLSELNDDLGLNRRNYDNEDTGLMKYRRKYKHRRSK